MSKCISFCNKESLFLAHPWKPSSSTGKLTAQSSFPIWISEIRCDPSSPDLRDQSRRVHASWRILRIRKEGTDEILMCLNCVGSTAEPPNWQERPAPRSATSVRNESVNSFKCLEFVHFSAILHMKCRFEEWRMDLIGKSRSGTVRAQSGDFWKINARTFENLMLIVQGSPDDRSWTLVEWPGFSSSALTLSMHWKVRS